MARRHGRGKEFKAKWQAFCAMLAERGGDVFDPEECKQAALHGLRGSAVVLRRMAGAAHQQISNDLGMSVQMVMHYSRFMDQRAAAESNILLLEDADSRKKGLKQVLQSSRRARPGSHGSSTESQ